MLVSTGNQLEFEPAGTMLRAEAAEHLHESLAKLPRHGAVEHEVDGVVDQRHGVQQVAQGVVHDVAEAVDEDVHESQDPLWQFSDGEEDHDGQQHPGGAVVLAMFVRFCLATLGLEQHPLPVSLVHGVDQKNGQGGQHAARNELYKNRLDPVVDL